MGGRDGVNVGVRVRVRVRFYACYGPESLLQGTAFQKTILKFLVFSRFYQTNKKDESNLYTLIGETFISNKNFN